MMPPASGPAVAPPPARRLRQPSWLDLPLVLGVVLVLASVVLGARLLAAADSSTRVWALRQDLSAGTTLTSDDVRTVRVRLFSDADRYLATTASPVGRTLTRDLGGGELLPRGALVGQPSGRLVSVPVSHLHAPETLHRGQLIDVFATTKVAAGGGGSTQRVLSSVPVQAVRVPRGGLTGATTEYAVLVRVPVADVVVVITAVRTAEIDVAVVTGGDEPAASPAR